MLQTLLSVAEVAAVAAFAYSGAALAAERRMDAIGLLTLAMAAGLGGGMVRDVLLDREVVAIHQWRLPLTCTLTALVVLVLGPVVRPAWLVVLIDAVGLGMFAVVGTERALQAGVPDVIAPMLGAITVAVGGLIRDVLALQNPALLYRSEVYVTPAIVGGFAYVAALALGAPRPATAACSAVGITVFRLLAWRFGWTVPEARRPAE